MKIKVSGRRFELTDAVKKRATTEIEKLDKFFDNIISANLVLSQANYRIDGELSMNVSRSKLVAKATTGDPLATIEMVTDKMAQQLKKHKGKMKDRQQRKVAERKSDVDVENSEEEGEY
ncbi:MAG: ribosome-associated translation inhibitor RaiA [candidate division Zixibacteria bacterium]|nr:ribosome-associated translation inhibitor RaiA [candidate division Zixibacteria bacterium]